jgi:hypothetical protein
MRRRVRTPSNRMFDEEESSSSVSSTSDACDNNNTGSITSSTDGSNTAASSMMTEEENDWNVLRRIFSSGWSNLPFILTGDLSYVPTERMMKRLDKLEDFSEKRHYNTKFGSRFVGINDYIHSMSREVVLYSKAIREDVEQGTNAAPPPKTKLDSIYEVYCKHFKESEGTRRDDNFKPLPLSNNKENSNHNHGSPSKLIRQKLDNLESSSELRHFTTKFGTPFIDDTLIQTTREEVFFTKMISGDVNEMVLAKAQPSELDKKYQQYLQSKINYDNATGHEVSSLSIFPNKAKTATSTDAFSLGSDWSESTLNTSLEEGPEEDESVSSLRSQDWAVLKKDPSSSIRTLIAEQEGVTHTVRCNLNSPIHDAKPKKLSLFSSWRINKKGK